jgi:tetratricopeptide (TPR) repeat protein
MDPVSSAPGGPSRYRGVDGGTLWSRPAIAPLADVLADGVEQARASYRDGRREEAISQATWIEQEAGLDRSEKLAAIGGAAAAVIGLCHRYDGQDDPARQAFTRAVAALRQAPAMVEERGDYAADLGVSLAALCETGRGAEAAEAEGLLRHAIELGENTPDVRCSLAVALRALGRFDSAVKLLSSSLERLPRDWQAAAELARTLQASGAPQAEVTGAWRRAALITHEFGPAARAATMFDLAEVTEATDPDVLTAAGQAWSNAGRHEDAVRAFERATRFRDDASGWLGLAQAHLAAEHAELALSALREALKRDPDSVSALLGIAEIAVFYLRQRDLLEEAEQCARRVTVLEPEEPDGYVVLGETLRLLGRYDEASRALDEAIAKLAPEEPLRAFALGTRGQVALALGDVPGAIADLEAAVALQPGLAWLHSDLGTARMMAYYAAERAGPQDRPVHLAGALDHLRKAVELDPADIRAALRLAEIQQNSGDNAGAEQTLLAALKVAAEPRAVYRALAEVRYRDGRMGEALAAVDEARALGDDAGTLLLRGQILSAMDRTPEALASLEQAIGMAPEDPAVLSRLGEVERQLDRLDEALAHLDEALRRQPDDGWILASRGAAYLQRGEAENAAADFGAALDAGEATSFLITRLGQAIRESDAPAALLQAWERAVERAPGEADLRAELGITYINLLVTAGTEARTKAGYVELAGKHLALAAEANGSDPVILLSLALARLLRGETKEAEMAMRAAMALRPGAETITDLAAAFHQVGLYAQALELADRALAAQGDLVRASAVRGHALFELRRFSEAEAPLSAVPEDERDVGVWAELGEVHRIGGEPARAVEELTRAHRMVPDDAWTLASLGAAQVAFDQAELGVASLRRALEITPGNLFALAQLRDALAGLGRSGEAVTVLAAAAERVPDDADVQIEYAIALGVAGRHRQALDVVDDVLLRAPDNATGLRVAGWLLTVLGRHSDAVMSYSRAVEVAPDDLDALVGLADALASDKRPIEAMSTLDRAAAVNETTDVAASRSRVFADLAMWTRAIAAGERAVELDPGNVLGVGALGWAIAHQQPVDAKRMHEVFQVAVGLDADDPWARKELGEALLLLRQTDEARIELLHAIDLSLGKPPTDFDAHWVRGWCLYLLGRHQEATEAYGQAEPGADSPVALAMDMGVNALVAGNEPEAQATYRRALSLAAKNPSLSLRGELATAVIDLRAAVELGWLTEGPLMSELIGTISAALQERPLPKDMAGAD